MTARDPMPRSLRFLAASLAALTIVTGCAKKEAGEEGGGGDEEKTPAVVGARTALVVARPFSETIGSIGTVVARAGHVAALAAPAQTRVAQVLVAPGDHVHRGQELVRLEATLFQASAQGAEARLTAAERAAERAERLANEGIAPRKDVEQARADLAAARAEAATARRTSELSVLRSPIDGVVTRMSATLGASVDPNSTLVEIADPSTVDLLFSLTPTDAARVRPGMPVTVGAGQSAGGEPLGVGNVVDIAGTVDTATRSVAVRVRAPSWRRPLRIGETVFGRIAVATRANALVVPNDALVPEGEGFKVFVVDGKGVAHAREVAIGARADSVTEIRSGLTAGERIVTYGAYGVQDSAKVVPVEAPPGVSAEDEKKGDKGDEKDEKAEKSAKPDAPAEKKK